jgi:hypothetical protein
VARTAFLNQGNVEGELTEYIGHCGQPWLVLWARPVGTSSDFYLGLGCSIVGPIQKFFFLTGRIHTPTFPSNKRSRQNQFQFRNDSVRREIGTKVTPRIVTKI